MDSSYGQNNNIHKDDTRTQRPALQKPLKYDADAFYDAGNTGCAMGPLSDIAAAIHKMTSGQTLEVRATDPTVKFDLPAWCRTTGHQIIEQSEDRFLIKVK